MTHEEIMHAAATNPFTKYCGIKLFRDENGNYISTIDISKNHLNMYGTVSAGLLYAMADTTGGMNCRKFFSKVVTLDSDLHFLANTSGGKLTCRAEIVDRGLRTAAVKVFLERTENAENILLGTGTFTYYCKA